MRRRFAALRWLRVRVPVIAAAVFALSLAVAVLLARELVLQDGQADIDLALSREHERFEVAVGELLDDELTADPATDPRVALDRAVRRYLELNPSNDTSWTIVTFTDGRRLAAANGPEALTPLFESRTLPTGEPNTRQTVRTEVGDIRTSSAPILVAGEELATLQVVSPLAHVREHANDAARLLAVAATAALLVGGTLLTASLWRSLTPLTHLVRAARTTDLRSLDTRVEAPPIEDEVGLLAREFNRMLDRLDAAAEAQQAFMASIGHELRTPITIARGHLELLHTVGRDDPAALHDTVAILEDELGRMGRLVDDLMAIARSQMHAMAEPRPLDLVAWFEDLELKLRGLPGAADVRLTPPPPVVVDADADRLAQAVLNLVANARAHTPDGTRVEVRAVTGDHTITIEVADDGPGIPEDIRDEILLPFVRGATPGSTGLGLAVVAAVADAHAGHVELDTGPGGTTVGIVLPWAGTPVLEDPPHDPGPAIAVAAPAGPPEEVD